MIEFKGAIAALLLFAGMLLPLEGQTLPSTRTSAAPMPTSGPVTWTVASDGTGDYKTVQDAIDAVPAYPYYTYTLHIKPGTYKELIIIPRVKPMIRFVGDDATTTILTYDLGATLPGKDGKPIGTYATPSTRILGDDFAAENITFENTFGNHGQALAIETGGDRIAFNHCRFLGWQDTIFADSNGRNYFHDCYIEGHVDFIFGKSTAVFDHCEIHSKARGYLTAASTYAGSPFGYVFLNCDLTAAPDVAVGSTYLGRPWRPASAVAFIDCRMGPHIKPEGWMNWGHPEREKTARYVEGGSTGPGGDMQRRVKWAATLTPSEAARYIVPAVLGGVDQWTPTGYVH